MTSALAITLLAAALTSAKVDVPKDGLAQANAALQSGEADRALTLLSSLPSSAETHNLRCRVHFMLENWDDAANECEQGLRLDGQSSNEHLWLGRALGEKADHASFISAYNLAKRSRAEFEQAVSLDPRNGEAMADLGEFYTSAPGVVGGGVDKARGLVPSLEKVDPARAHILLARIAESQKDIGAAEREFRLAAMSGDHPAFGWMSLASFYRKHERWDQMDAAVENGYKAAQHDRHAGVALYNGSSVLARSKRNLPLAVKMLEEYLRDFPHTEEGPAFEAYTRLARLKAQLGDKNGALQAKAAALQLAHNYKPALGLTF
ncbi:hypothetical protein P8935_15140 [Telmatobacter sp. DSM 110680]|uniref:Tetratricopeptide repeat protein n=1 Tax=Telmatobacter sp. DSM 110680 TaxID=3036704 RepID=A0AAU7DGG5_9BACT